MISYIYTITNQSEALSAISAGANVLCLTPAHPSGRQKGQIARREVKKIQAAAAGKAQILLQGFSSDPGQYMDLGALSPDMVQICGDFATHKEFYRVFKLSCPGVKLVQSVSAAKLDDIEKAVSLAWHCDYLYLQNPNLSIARQIIMAVGVPVILNCDGASADLLKGLDPYGAATGVATDRDNSAKKDFEAVEQFCAMVQTL